MKRKNVIASSSRSELVCSDFRDLEINLIIFWLLEHTDTHSRPPQSHKYNAHIVHTNINREQSLAHPKCYVAHHMGLCSGSVLKANMEAKLAFTIFILQLESLHIPFLHLV